MSSSQVGELTPRWEKNPPEVAEESEPSLPTVMGPGGGLRTAGLTVGTLPYPCHSRPVPDRSLSSMGSEFPQHEYWEVSPPGSSWKTPLHSPRSVVTATV